MNRSLVTKSGFAALVAASALMAASAPSQAIVVGNEVHIGMKDNELPVFEAADVDKLISLVNVLKEDPFAWLGAEVTHSLTEWRGKTSPESASLNHGILGARAIRLSLVLKEKAGFDESLIDRLHIFGRPAHEKGEPPSLKVFVRRSDLRQELDAYMDWRIPDLVAEEVERVLCGTDGKSVLEDWLAEHAPDLLAAEVNRTLPGILDQMLPDAIGKALPNHLSGSKFGTPLIIPLVRGDDLPEFSPEDSREMADRVAEANRSTDGRIIIFSPTEVAAEAVKGRLSLLGLHPARTAVIPYRAQEGDLYVALIGATGIGDWFSKPHKDTPDEGQPIVVTSSDPEARIFLRGDRVTVDSPERLRNLIERVRRDPQGRISVHPFSRECSRYDRADMDRVMTTARVPRTLVGGALFRPTQHDTNWDADLVLDLYRIEGRRAESAVDWDWDKDNTLTLLVGAGLGHLSGWDDHLTPGVRRTKAFTTLDLGLNYNDRFEAVCHIQPPGALFNNEDGELNLAKVSAFARVAGPLCLGASYARFVSRKVHRNADLPDRDLVFEERVSGMGPAIHLRFPNGFGVGGAVYFSPDRDYTLPRRDGAWNIPLRGDDAMAEVYISFRNGPRVNW